MQTFNGFQEMTMNAEQSDIFGTDYVDSFVVIENSPIDFSSDPTPRKVPPVDPIQQVGDNMPIPQRVKSLEDRVTALELKVDRGFASVRQEMTGKFDEMSSKFDRLSSKFDELSSKLDK